MQLYTSRLQCAIFFGIFSPSDSRGPGEAATLPAPARKTRQSRFGGPLKGACKSPI
jgi:hypothetical protein